jgi:23S rRNA pseudouridine1911/1915/1917 synthase
MIALTVDILKSRLDKFLASSLSEISRAQIQRDIELGSVSVNGAVVAVSKHIVRINDKVEYNFQGKKEELTAKNIPIKTLYNNHGLLILDKPAGLSVHPGAGVKGDSLAEALLFHFADIKLVGEEGRPGIVHRLDKDTSGVILVARTQDVYEYLKDAFAERKIKKEYIALVVGAVEKPHGFIEEPIGKSKSDFRRYTTKDMILPKPSLTEYQVIERLDGYTLVRVKLHTGRTHQIRVHFSSLGHPLAGDSLYGGKRSELKGLQRQFLHASRIEVRLPDETWIEADSSLPQDLKQVLTDLGSTKVKQL